MNIEKKILKAIFIDSSPDFDPAALPHLAQVFRQYQSLISRQDYLALLKKYQIPFPQHWSHDGIRQPRRKYKSFAA